MGITAFTPLDWLDRRVGLPSLIDNPVEANKIDYGLFGFTPENITQAALKQGDRPYASLVYTSSSHERYDVANEVSWTSTLTVGFMGFSIVGDIQHAIHANINSDRPRGWQNQISDGGELTVHYNLARQQLIYQSSDAGLELKSTLQGSAGYITEASWNLSLRAGSIQSPWVSFNPELTSYGEKSISSDLGRVVEHYFWTGIAVKARAYNAFLQGQFRNTLVSYDSDELNHSIVEAWVGYRVGLSSGYSITYSIRGHTSELKRGIGNRNVVWGSLQFNRNFN